MINYYDPLYGNKADKYEYQLVLSGTADPEKAAQTIKKWIERTDK
jgi:hypothetical protein